jgi:basic membrane protein A
MKINKVLYFVLALIIGLVQFSGSLPVKAESEDFSDQLVIYVTSKPLGTNQFHILGKNALAGLEEKYGVQTDYYESENDPTNREENIRAAVNAGANIIYVLGTEWGDIIPQVASENEDVDFLIADQCVDDQLPNIHCTVFKEQEASFLLGVIAASLTETDHIGAIGALDIPFLHRYTDGFIEGAKYIKPDIKTELRWVGGDNPFGDPARGKEQALAIFSTGADQIFSAAAGSDLGVFEGAAQNDFYAYGVDVNNCAIAPGKVSDNLLKHIDVAVIDAIGKILTEKPESLFVSVGVAEGAVGPGAISEKAEDNEGCVVMEHPEIIELVKEVAAKINSGEIVIEDPMFK